MEGFKDAFEKEMEWLKSGKYFMVVRVLWLRGRSLEEAYNRYLEKIVWHENELVEEGVLTDMETVIELAWDEETEQLFHFLKKLGKLYKEARRLRGKVVG